VSPVDVGLVAAAFLFALVTGANNGGTLVAVQLRGSHSPPWVPVVLLAAAVGAGPALVGTGVASTVAERLAVFAGSGHDFALATTLVASMGVVLVMSRMGLPTSLFAALIGSITGAAAGLGLRVEWANVGVVLLAAVITPWVGAVLAWVTSRAQHLAGPGGPTRRWRSRSQLVSYVALCAAYGANGAQILVALLALSFERSPRQIGSDPWLLAGLAACFAVGTLVGLEHLSGSIGSGIIPLRPQQAATSKLASTVAVGAAAALGLPVSTTQVVTASLIGCGAAESYRRIRWQHAQRIIVAWAMTVPATFCLAAAAGLAGRPFV
jgi:PiT family inorganic phosphate transporter